LSNIASGFRYSFDIELEQDWESNVTATVPTEPIEVNNDKVMWLSFHYFRQSDTDFDDTEMTAIFGSHFNI
jgi:hypothetical protein